MHEQIESIPTSKDHAHKWRYWRLTTPSRLEDCFVIYYCGVDECQAYDVEIITAVEIDQFAID